MIVWGKWRKKSRYREVATVCFPLVMSMAAVTVMQFTDRIFFIQLQCGCHRRCSSGRYRRIAGDGLFQRSGWIHKRFFLSLSTVVPGHMKGSDPPFGRGFISAFFQVCWLLCFRALSLFRFLPWQVMHRKFSTWNGYISKYCAGVLFYTLAIMHCRLFLPEEELPGR